MKTSRLDALWAFCCSLKLAIVLATLTTLLGILGSLVVHFHPELFGNLDRLTLGDWLARTALRRSDLTWWLWLAGILLILLGLNTLCCFFDWLWKINRRWRKCGEYLIHAGFVLVLTAFIWGSLAGTRDDQRRLNLGDRLAVTGMAGLELQLIEFEPQLNEQGRPLDMLNRIVLWRDGERLLEQQVRINHPLTYCGLVVVPVSFGQEIQGFRVFQPDRGQLEMVPGRRYAFPGEAELLVHDFLPDVRRSADGRVLKASGQLRNPALRLELRRSEQTVWTGWYLLREPLPFPLVANGIRFWPVEPISSTFSILTINFDPGARLALWGGGLMMAGVILAIGSFYRKRLRRDHPDIA